MDRLEKLLARMPAKHRAQVLEVLACLQDPLCRPRLRIEKLSGLSSFFRIRAGKYRVIFVMFGDSVDIIEVRPRNESTYKNF